MNFLQFVEAVRLGTPAEAIAASQTLESAPGLLYVYIATSVSLTSELAFFDLERVPPDIFITVDGVAYEAFFSVPELADLLVDYTALLGAAATPAAIAKAILDYHHYDA